MQVILMVFLLLVAVLPLFAGFAVAAVAIDALGSVRNAWKTRDVSRRILARMSEGRQIVTLSLSSLGAYYVALSLITLVTLPSVTRRWIALSGDPDFRFDYGLFLMCLGVGATLVLLFGIATVASGLATVLGKPSSAWHWKCLAIAAPIIHFPWFIYRSIATGTMASRGEAIASARLFAFRCIIICASYALLWTLARRPPVQSLSHAEGRV